MIEKQIKITLEHDLTSVTVQGWDNKTRQIESKFAARLRRDDNKDDDR